MGWFKFELGERIAGKEIERKEGGRQGKCVAGKGPGKFKQWNKKSNQKKNKIINKINNYQNKIIIIKINSNKNYNNNNNLN